MHHETEQPHPLLSAFSGWGGEERLLNPCCQGSALCLPLPGCPEAGLGPVLGNSEPCCLLDKLSYVTFSTTPGSKDRLQGSGVIYPPVNSGARGPDSQARLLLLHGLSTCNLISLLPGAAGRIVRKTLAAGASEP